MNKKLLKLPPFQLPLAQASNNPYSAGWTGAYSSKAWTGRLAGTKKAPLAWTLNAMDFQAGGAGSPGFANLDYLPVVYCGKPATILRPPRAVLNYTGLLRGSAIPAGSGGLGLDIGTAPSFDINAVITAVQAGLDAKGVLLGTISPYLQSVKNGSVNPGIDYGGLLSFLPATGVYQVGATPPAGSNWVAQPPGSVNFPSLSCDPTQWQGGQVLAYVSAMPYAFPSRNTTSGAYAASVLTTQLNDDIAAAVSAYQNFDKLKVVCYYFDATGLPADFGTLKPWVSPWIARAADTLATITAGLGSYGLEVRSRATDFCNTVGYENEIIADIRAFFGI